MFSKKCLPFFFCSIFVFNFVLAKERVCSKVLSSQPAHHRKTVRWSIELVSAVIKAFHAQGLAINSHAISQGGEVYKSIIREITGVSTGTSGLGGTLLSLRGLIRKL